MTATELRALIAKIQVEDGISDAELNRVCREHVKKPYSQLTRRQLVTLVKLIDMSKTKGRRTA